MIANFFKRISSTESAPCTRQHRMTAIFMLVVTMIYLIVELAFNARLLDVVGSVESHEAVEAIEVWGRLISGTALALYLLGNILFNAADKRWSKGNYILGSIRMVLVCTVAMVAVYFGQKALIDVITHFSTPEARRRAAVLVPITKLVQSGQLTVDGLELNADDFGLPAGKTFLATLPLQALNHPQLFEKLEGNVQPIFRAYAVRMREGTSADTDVYSLYKKSVDEATDQYDNRYISSNENFQKETSKRVAREQSDAWEQYKQKLRNQRRNMTPYNINKYYWKRVRDEVRGMGVRVPDNWVPSDQATFNAAVRKRVLSEAESRFEDESKAKIGVRISPGKNRREFFDGLEYEWRKKFEFSSDIKMIEGLNKERFDAEVYPRIIANDVARLMKTNYAKPEDYKARGRFAKQGEDMFRALIVPPIALCFSLLGAMVHIFKVFGFAAKIVVSVPKMIYRGAFAIYMALVAFIPYQIGNKVTKQELFGKLEKYTVDNFTGGSGIALGVRWVTQFQPYFYPINNFSREKLLGGHRFDQKIDLEDKVKSISQEIHQLKT